MSTPIDVARALHAGGETFEAEVIVLGALARDPSDTDARSASMAIRRGQRLGAPASAPAIDLRLVDRWIRAGMLVEALALLVANPMSGDDERVREWADLLGELLAPVPAHAEPVFVEMHRQLLRGAATVAMAVLEDRAAEGPLPPWASRRLALLRWMLLDNAQPQAQEEKPAAATSPLARALQPALAQRSLTAARDAAGKFVQEHPQDDEAAEVLMALEALVDEMAAHDHIDLMGGQTVPVMGRPAAAMQLQMASLQGAAALYRKLSSGQVTIPEARGLLYSVETVLRALEPRAEPERTFKRPVADDAGFEDATKPASEQLRRLAASPVAQGAPRSGTWDEDEGPTRVAQRGELPLTAFDDSQTREVRLPDDLPPIDPPTVEQKLDEPAAQGTFMDTERSGMAEAVQEARAELDMGEPTDVSTAPLSTELTMVDVDVEVGAPKTVTRGQVVIARVIKVGG